MLFLPSLSCQFFKQLSAGAVLLNLAVQFVDIVAHRHQKKLGQNLFAAAKPELPETVILFDDPEGTLRLNGMVHP